MNKLSLLIASALLFSITACSSGTSTQATATAPSAAANIYATNVAGSTALTGQILTFPTSSTGAATPTSTFSDAANISAGYLASDTNGNIYAISSTVYASTNTSVAVYTHTASGVLTLSRTITSSAMSGQGPIAVDKSGNLYVSQFGKTLVFSPTANGASTPTATIAGYSGFMATDPSGDLYIQSGSTVVAFNASSIASGVPSRTISSAAFNGPVSSVSAIASIATDVSGNLYVLTVTPGLVTSTSPAPEILVFSSSASGSPTPTRTITGATTRMYQPAGLAVDAAGTIYVYDFTSSAPLEGLFLQFSSSANGNVAPASSFTSAAATYSAGSIAVF